MKKQYFYFYWSNILLYVSVLLLKYLICVLCPPLHTGDPYSQFVLCIYPSKVHTHSSEHTHTMHTHPEQCAVKYAAAPGEQLGVLFLLKSTSVVVLKVERVLYIHSPHLQFLPARDSTPQPFDYESDSITLDHDFSPNLYTKFVCTKTNSKRTSFSNNNFL